MKRLLPFVLSAMTISSMSAASDVPSGVFEGELVSALSNNGQWMVGNLEGAFSVVIRDLVNNRTWEYDDYDPESSIGNQYGIGLDKVVSDTGVVIGTVNDEPSYWVNGTWHSLPVKSATGKVQLGSITPDGSMIVGALGNQTTDDPFADVLFTAPCIWYRNADGSYAEPVFLPIPERDITNAIPQYFTLISVSDDGETIGAQMTCNYGYPHVPFVYTKNTDGEWNYKMLAGSLINPQNLVFPEFAGSYNGPERPNYELYITEAEMKKYEAAFPEWAARMEAEGYTDEQIELLNLTYVAEFMSGEKKVEYLGLLQIYLAAYEAWAEDYKEYETQLSKMLTYGMDFVFNNLRISPDGKYIFSTGSLLKLVRPDNPENPFDEEIMPVVMDTATGECRQLSSEYSVLISSVTADYSVLGSEFLGDQYLDRRAFIFPQAQTEGIDMLEYFEQQENTAAVEWMDENMYREVETLSPTGSIIVKDVYSMGIPYATPDMSLIAFKTSTFYWVVEEPYLWVTFLLNPALGSGVGCISAEENNFVKILPDACLEISGELASIEIYNIAGANLFKNSNPSGIVSTGLPSGIYLIKTVGINGEINTFKAVL